MKIIRLLFNIGYGSIVALFFCAGAGLIYYAALELWTGLWPGNGPDLRERLNAVLESIGLITIAVAALELGQTVLEEEILRQAHIVAPTRIRRFLSRFLVVVVIALCIESLVAVFQVVRKDVTQLPQAASVAVAAAILLASWGVFVKLNRSAEELEPEAMERTKQEDEHID